MPDQRSANHPDYRSVKVPFILIEEVLRVIKNHKELGYRNHTEFVNEAVRLRLEDIKKLIREE